MKKIILTTVMFVIFLPSITMAKNMGGFIDSNTTWTTADSPFNLISDVQVMDGVILTIEAGVEVNGNNNKIINAGEVLAIGVAELDIVFTDVVFENAKDREYALLSFNYCLLNESSFYGWFSDGKLVITNSVLSGPSNLTVYLLGTAFGSDEMVELVGNTFNDIVLTLSYCSTNNATIKNNVFEGNSKIVGHGGAANILNNSFLNTDIEVVQIDPNFGKDIIATGNYWNTTNTSVIKSMIFDGNDDLNVTGHVTYEPFLTAPPVTSSPVINQPPTAKARIDQIGFDTITLNASESSDPDGDALTYSWQLNHRTNSTNNRTAIGIAPTISNLKSGFYDVILTIQDDGSLTDTDTMMFSATDTHVPDVDDDIIVIESQKVVLNGLDSFDDDGVVSWKWIQKSGPSVVLSDPYAISPSFIAPEIDQNGIAIEFQLTVSDHIGKILFDNCTVHIIPKEFEKGMILGDASNLLKAFSGEELFGMSYPQPDLNGDGHAGIDDVISIFQVLSEKRKTPILPISLEVMPTDKEISLGLNQQFSVNAVYKDGSTSDVTNFVKWESYNPLKALINSKGFVRTEAEGESSICASYYKYKACTSITITEPELIGIDIQPENEQLFVGDTEWFRAVGIYSNGNMQKDVTDRVSWKSSDISIATIDNATNEKGKLKTINSGVTTISATLDDISVSTLLTVDVNPNYPNKILVNAAPRYVLNDGIDTTLLSVSVIPYDTENGKISDGTIVKFEILSGSGILSETSAETVDGEAAITFKSSMSGTVMIRASEEVTGVNSTFSITVVSDLNAIFTRYPNSSIVEINNVYQAGSQFQLTIKNNSDRIFDVLKFEIINGSSSIAKTTDVSLLSNGQLSEDESVGLSITLMISQFNNGVTAIFYLLDVRTGQNFSVSYSW